MSANVVVEDARVSRRHFEVGVDAARWTVRDLRSRHGTHLNGQAVDSAASNLESGGVIRAGSTLFVFREGVAPDDGDDPLLPGLSPAMVALRADLRKIAARRGHVLIHGETGTGKDYVARFLRAKLGDGCPLVTVNCAQLVGELAGPNLFGNVAGAWTGARAHEGVVAAANGGILFLDEIADLKAHVQAELLLFLESGRYALVGAPEKQRQSNAWVLAATHVDLERAVALGQFRMDLLGRLRSAGAVVTVPALRDRPEDVPLWVRRFAPENRTWTCSFAEQLMGREWLRNLRELREVVSAADRATPLGEPLRAHDLPSGGGSASDSAAPVAPPAKEVDRDALLQALNACDGNKSRAARLLGLERTKLHRLLRVHGLAGTMSTSLEREEPVEE